MYITAQTIINLGALITAIGVLFAILFKIHKWYLKQEKQDEDIKHMKEENRVICKGVLACLDGLEQLGCNHTVPVAKGELEEYLNKSAHI